MRLLISDVFSETVSDSVEYCSSILSILELTPVNSNLSSLIKLLNGNVNLKCPHGRPIAVKITRAEIDKWFKRIV